jgi:PAS domain S-box-containing protein
MEYNRDFNGILDIAPFACILMSDDYSIRYINPNMMDFLNPSQEKKLNGEDFLQFLPEEEQSSFIDFINSLNKPLNEQRWRVFNIIDANQETKKLLLNGVNNSDELPLSSVYFLVGMPLFNENLRKILPEFIDQDLIDKISYNKYETLFNSATIGILVLDEDGYVDELNQTFADYFNITKEEAYNKHYTDLFLNVIEEDFDKLIRMVNTAKNRPVKNIITLENVEGESSILEISLEKIDSYGNHNDQIMLISDDITEEQETQTALIQSEKLALTGRLAASLAHEINNPLQTSIGCLGLAEEMLDDDDRDLSVYINMAMEELQRSARIVKKLRDLNRSTDPEDKEPIDLQELLDGVLVLTKNRLYDRNIVPVYPYQGPPPIVPASKDLIRQVLLNLMMNAIDALPNGGNIYLDILHTEDPKGFNVKIRDTGVGMSQEIIDNLFDPFFTTKEEGLGLGLYICKKIIDDHNGKLTVESEPDQGTEFSVWLPGLNVENRDEE